MDADGGIVIAAVVLAAGLSSRMGRNKLLIPMADERTMIAHAVDAAIDGGLGPVVVVTGHQAEKIETALEGRAVRFVRNDRFADGMAGSVKTGIAALPSEVNAAMIFLGDMPGVTADHVRRLAIAFNPGDGGIRIPTREGKRGHPVLFDRRFFAEIAAMPEDVGLRAVVAAHPDAIRTVPMDDDAVLADLDTEAALAAALAETA